MYAAVIEKSCGLAAWRPNSALGYATSASSPDGPFTFQRYIKPHFAHEPVALMMEVQYLKKCLCGVVLLCTVLFCFCTVLFCFVLYYDVLFCIDSHCIVL